MIAIRSLHKEFGAGSKALRGIDLHIERGEFAVLLGPSGAGKSTLLRCINGLTQPTAGEIYVNGEPVYNHKDMKAMRRRIGMIFQQFNLVKRLTVVENVLCGCLAHTNVFASCLKLFTREEIDFAAHCLDRVGLAQKAYYRADQLSGGQQQRVGIARALAQRPDIILADEPVASLDPKSAVRVMEILRDINQQDGITVLVSLHNIELANYFAQRVIGIKDGRIVLDHIGGELTGTDVGRIYDEMDIGRTEYLDSDQAGYAHA